MMYKVVALSMLVLAGSFAVAEASAEPSSKAIEFTLEDPSKKKVKVSFPREKPLFLSLADREGSEQIPDWAKPVKEAFADRVEHIGVADLQAIPSLMRGPIRLFFKGVEGYVLLDWEGEVCKQYKVKAKTALIVILDRDGTVLSRHEGAADDEQVSEIIEILNAHFDAANASSQE